MITHRRTGILVGVIAILAVTMACSLPSVTIGAGSPTETPTAVGQTLPPAAGGGSGMGNGAGGGAEGAAVAGTAKQIVPARVIAVQRLNLRPNPPSWRILPADLTMFSKLKHWAARPFRARCAAPRNPSAYYLSRRRSPSRLILFRKTPRVAMLPTPIRFHPQASRMTLPVPTP